MLRVTQINASGFSVSSEHPVDDYNLPAALEAVDNFTVDITFEGKYPTDTVDPVSGLTSTTYQYANATDVTSTFNWSSIGITYSKPNAYTVRLTGPARNVFTNQYYQFTMPDYTQQQLQPDTSAKFLSLSRYSKPNPTSVMETYPFAVTIPATYGSSSTTVENYSMTQWFYWSYLVAFANIAALKGKGTR